MDYKQQKRRTVNVLFIIVTTSFIWNASNPLTVLVQGSKDPVNLFCLFSYGFIDLFRCLYVAQLFLSCKCLQIRFHRLNETLNSSNNNSNVSIISEKVSMNWKFGKVYYGLCDGIDILNDSFTFHFVFLFTSILVR